MCEPERRCTDGTGARPSLGQRSASGALLKHAAVGTDQSQRRGSIDQLRRIRRRSLGHNTACVRPVTLVSAVHQSPRSRAPTHAAPAPAGVEEFLAFLRTDLISFKHRG